MSIPPQKRAELKQIIHNQLTQADIQQRIKNAVSSALSQNEGDTEPVTEDQILSDLKRQGLVQNLLEKLKFESPIYEHETKPATHKPIDEEVLQAKITQKAAIDPTRRYVYLQVLGGKAFLDHLNAPAHPKAVDQECSTFSLHINFRGQRFRSRSVPVACEPAFCESFLLEIHSDESGEGAVMADMKSMLFLADDIHLVVMQHETDGTSSLVSSHYIQWRNVLTATHQRMKKSIELMGIGTECKIPAGILDIQLELIPPTREIALSKDLYEAQLQLEKQRIAERDRLFLVYAKQWWKEYLQIREEHSSRSVKIFAQDENGTNRLVCNYVRPMSTGRLLNTPRSVARFVSAFVYEKATMIGSGTKNQYWQSMHSFLCCKKGDHEEHSNLLCSLLLGFGLQAYVCIGTKKTHSSYSWVMTKYCDGSVQFWDPVSGLRYIHCRVEPDDPPIIDQGAASHPFKTVDCLYNHESFYANSQFLNAVETCRFDLNDSSLWKQMNRDAIHSVCGAGKLNSSTPFPPLATPTLDAILVSSNLEIELRSLVVDYRSDFDLITTWDDNLSRLLAASLASYELERQSGIPNIGNEDFQDMVRRAVPNGNTFKGFPLQVLHRDARRAFKTALRNSVCTEILNCRGDQVRHSLRVVVSVLPDDVLVAWVMFACRYQSVL
uniref:Centrosomal protein of 76 kDa n=1 Tax=Phallusia mammillata TaxID=59560 RepID=A0A6F9D8G8_9ASCI|nr:centrosomal protein of 76 kDa-like [Phallusia mammillata]